jgi:hypothetical protein
MSPSNYALNPFLLRSPILLGRLHRLGFKAAVVAIPAENVRNISQPPKTAFLSNAPWPPRIGDKPTPFHCARSGCICHSYGRAITTGNGARSHRGQVLMADRQRMPFSALAQADFQRSHWPQHNAAEWADARFRPASFPRRLGPGCKAPATHPALGERTHTSALSLIPLQIPYN